MLQYSEYVKCALMALSRSGMLSAGAAAAMDERKRAMNHGREYWYMGSRAARSDMQKNSVDVYVPHGLYLHK